jgi:hypothetical protein
MPVQSDRRMNLICCLTYLSIFEHVTIFFGNFLEYLEWSAGCADYTVSIDNLGKHINQMARVAIASTARQVGTVSNI